MFSLGARRYGSLGTVACLAAAFVFMSARADAHFKIDAPACWMSQDMLGGPQKKGPCAAMGDTALGDPQGTPTNTITVENGGTVTVSITVTIAHPGWFRVSLAEGPSSSQTLTTLPDPVAVNGTSCTPALMPNPVWSSTQPIIADGLGLPAGSTSTTTMQTGAQTFQVTIPPAATCTSARPCTLQVIMMMTDHPVTDCYYHHCADIAFETTSDASAGDSTVKDSAASSSAAGDASLETTDASDSASGTSASDSGGSTGSSSASASSGGGGGGPQNGGSAGSSGGSTAPSTGVGGGTDTGTSQGSGASSEPQSSKGGCAIAMATSGGKPWAIAALGLVALGSVRRRGQRR
jgi:MYXO-CTERM domain-containing protein